MKAMMWSTKEHAFLFTIELKNPRLAIKKHRFQQEILSFAVRTMKICYKRFVRKGWMTTIYHSTKVYKYDRFVFKFQQASPFTGN